MAILLTKFPINWFSDMMDCIMGLATWNTLTSCLQLELKVAKLLQWVCKMV